jgi:hypothetical protein
LQAFRIVLTKPSFRNMLVVVLGWLLTQGPHAVTEALVMAGVAGQRHHAAFHRFFSRARWEPDEMGRWIFHRLLPFLGEGAVQAVIDDALAPKKGPHVFGIASHVDAVRSTRRHRVFCFGHCWVVLAVLVSVPFSKRTWALSVLFRLYRSMKETASDEAAEYAKKTELARELLHGFVGWVGDRRVEFALDAGFCNSTVTQGLPPSVVVFGAMRPDAVLTAEPEARPEGARGRPKVRGKALPTPSEVADDKDRPWEKAEAFLYGKRTTVHFKTFCAQWYRVCGAHLLRVEVFFREAKQLLGFADSAARLERAVRRVAPLAGLLYTVLVVWFLEHHGRSFTVSPPLRPWYGHKSGLSFADILRYARRAIATANILDLINDSHNFKNAPPPPPAHPSSERLAA